ncbi:uncharacterized protein LOC113386487 [Ctenocephalides felis]|uniref:uncharacterized protein LOC113386487 n=1 Tax=Ctenocephalides felis TaxID=7515 RepID=UPI000E6E5A47|nr:uncharacterized protein LOC113386487 [Ctenocephalides felis]
MKPKHIQNKTNKPPKCNLKKKPKLQTKTTNPKIAEQFEKIKQVRLKLTQQLQSELKTCDIKKQIITKQQERLFPKSPPAIVKKTVEIPIKELQNALNDLNKGEMDNPYVANKCKRSIVDLVNSNQNSEYSSCSYTNLCYEIHKCILNHDWKSLTACFLLLLDGPVSLRQVIWKVAMVILFHNPYVKNSGIMEDFLKMCACCQTEAEMEEFLQKILVLPDKLSHLAKPTFKSKAKDDKVVGE